MRDPGKKRFIALADFLPIVAGHIGVPVEVAFDAPGFVEHFAPLFAGVNFHLEFAEVELAIADLGFAGRGIGDSVDRTGLVDDFFAFLVEVVAINAFEQHFVFALGYVINVEDIFRATVGCAELTGLLGRGDVEKLVLACCKVIQNAGADRDGGYAPADAVQVDLNRLDRLRFLFVLLFFFLLVGCFFLIALGLERRSLIGFQRYGKDAVGRVVIEALIELADARIEIARGNEIEIFPVFVEDGIVVAIEARRNLGDFLRSQRIKKDIVGTAAVRFGISEPKAVGRPTAVGDGAVLGLVHEYRLLVVQADVPELQHFVPVEELLAVGRPDGTVAVDAAIVGDARFVAAHLRARVELELAGFVGEIRDRLSVRRPGGVQFVDTGVIGGQRSNAAVLSRNGENIAAGFHQGASRGGRERIAADGLRDALEFRASFDVFGADHDGETARFSGGEVEFVKHAAIFVDDGVGPEARPLDVVFLVVGEFFRLLGTEVVAKEVHHAVAVADEIDSVAVPHGEEVHAGGLRQLFVGIFFEIENGDGEAPAAAVALPSAEFLGSFEVGDPGAVRREAGQARARNLKRLRRAALWGDEKELDVTSWRSAETVRTEENVFAIGRPTEDDVVAGMKGEALGLAAFGGDDIHVGVAVIFAGEGDPFAVRRQFGVELVTDVGRQPAGRAAVARGDPQITGVGKNHFIFGDVGETEEFRRPVRHLVRGLRRSLSGN